MLEGRDLEEEELFGFENQEFGVDGFLRADPDGVRKVYLIPDRRWGDSSEASSPSSFMIPFSSSVWSRLSLIPPFDWERLLSMISIPDLRSGTLGSMTSYTSRLEASESRDELPKISAAAHRPSPEAPPCSMIRLGLHGSNREASSWVELESSLSPPNLLSISPKIFLTTAYRPGASLVRCKRASLAGGRRWEEVEGGGSLLNCLR